MGKIPPIPCGILVTLLMAGFLLGNGDALLLHRHPPDPPAGEDPSPSRGDGGSAHQPAATLSPDPHERHPIGSVFPDRKCLACPLCRNGSYLPPEIHTIRSAFRIESRVQRDRGASFAGPILSTPGIRAPPSI